MDKSSTIMKLATWLLTAVISGCSIAPVYDMDLNGKLVYAGGQAVYELDLSSLEKRTLFEPTKYMLVSASITRVGNAIVVTDIFSRMHYVSYEEKSHRIGKGSDPVYMPKHRKLLFVHKAEGRSEASLYEADLYNGVMQSPNEILLGPLGTYGTPPVVPISEHEVVFSREDGALFKYDLRTRKIIELPVSGCDPIAWRSATAQVLCYYREPPYDLSLVSLDGRGEIPVPELSELTAAWNGPYLPARDALFISDGRFFTLYEVSDLFLYDFSEGTLRRIAKEVSFFPGTAFWVGQHWSLGN